MSTKDCCCMLVHKHPAVGEQKGGVGVKRGLIGHFRPGNDLGLRLVGRSAFCATADCAMVKTPSAMVAPSRDKDRRQGAV